MEKLSILGSGNLSDHLTRSEVRAKSTGSLTDIDAKLPVLFELVRLYGGGKPVSINSAIRNFVPSGGVKDSEHMTGTAFDLGLSSGQLQRIKDNINAFMLDFVSAGGVGLGVYSWGLHVDTGFRSPAKYWWGNNSGEWPIRHWGNGFFGLHRSDPIAPLQYSSDNIDVDVEQISDDEAHKVGILPYLLGLVLAFFTIKTIFK